MGLFFVTFISVTSSSDTQNLDELLHLDNQPVSGAKGGGGLLDDAVNANEAPPAQAPAPAALQRNAFDENNAIAQDAGLSQQGMWAP